MKLSEALAQLNAVYAKYGDIEVEVFPYDGQMNTCLAEKIEVVTQETVAWNTDKNDWVYKDCTPKVCITD